MSARTLALLIIGTSLGFVGFAVLLMMTSENIRLQKNATADPETIRLVELGSRAADANRHLTLTEFGLGHDYLYRGKFDNWDRVWVPLIDPQSTKEKPRVLAVMIHRHCKNLFDMMSVRGTRSFTGMNVTGVHVIPSELQQQLEGFYPGHDLSQIPVFEEGEIPPTDSGLVATQVVMILLLAIGLVSAISWITLAKWHSQGAHAAVAV